MEKKMRSGMKITIQKSKPEKMNPVPMYEAPLLKRSQSLRMHDTLLERIIVPVVTLAITVTLSVLWHLHRDELLQRACPR
ncbi:hypothetical protein CCACVL1_19662 [Corchorus capsularis]|uniref:Uncharacterized protein n=1 Tax=Corchorus capsularis TaxID=210143 RepID=A0A1R3HFL7_COCAP|nr:hypothetical protein CCACVL1_19662 [Corchorus capsularis]